MSSASEINRQRNNQSHLFGDEPQQKRYELPQETYQGLEAANQNRARNLESNIFSNQSKPANTQKYASPTIPSSIRQRQQFNSNESYSPSRNQEPQMNQRHETPDYYNSTENNLIQLRNHKSSFQNMQVSPASLPSIDSSYIQSSQVPQLSAFPEINFTNEEFNTNIQFQIKPPTSQSDCNKKNLILSLVMISKIFGMRLQEILNNLSKNTTDESH